MIIVIDILIHRRNMVVSVGVWLTMLAYMITTFLFGRSLLQAKTLKLGLDASLKVMIVWLTKYYSSRVSTARLRQLRHGVVLGSLWLVGLKAETLGGRSFPAIMDNRRCISNCFHLSCCRVVPASTMVRLTLIA